MASSGLIGVTSNLTNSSSSSSSSSSDNAASILAMILGGGTGLFVVFCVGVTWHHDLRSFFHSCRRARSHLVTTYLWALLATCSKTFAWWLNQFPTISAWPFMGRWAISVAAAGSEYFPLTKAMTSAKLHHIHMGLMTAVMEAADNMFRMLQQLALNKPLALYDWCAAIIMILCVAWQAVKHYAEDQRIKQLRRPSTNDNINNTTNHHDNTTHQSMPSHSDFVEHSHEINTSNDTVDNICFNNENGAPVAPTSITTEMESFHDSVFASASSSSSSASTSSSSSSTSSSPITTTTTGSTMCVPGELVILRTSISGTTYEEVRTRQDSTLANPFTSASITSSSASASSSSSSSAASALASLKAAPLEKLLHMSRSQQLQFALLVLLFAVLLMVVALLGGAYGAAYVLATVATTAKTFAWWINQYPALRKLTFVQKWGVGWSIAACLEYFPLIGAFTVASNNGVHLGVMTAYMEVLDNCLRMVQQYVLGKPLATYDYIAASGMALAVILQAILRAVIGDDSE